MHTSNLEQLEALEKTKQADEALLDVLVQDTPHTKTTSTKAADVSYPVVILCTLSALIVGMFVSSVFLNK